jgi:hypothetical protein
MSKIDESLNLVGDLLKKDIAAQLAIGEKSGQTYNAEEHGFLENTLKFTSCPQTQELREKKATIELTSLKMELVKEFNDIQKIFGPHIILDYAGLFKLCNDHNLYFGHTPLFCGEITPEALKQSQEFNFVKARSVLRVAKCIEGEPVVNWNYDVRETVDLIIAAPITMFKLNSPHKIIISQREIIQHPRGSSPKPKGVCSEHDPILLLPFRSTDKRIYFVVITNWEN